MWFYNVFSYVITWIHMDPGPNFLGVDSGPTKLGTKSSEVIRAKALVHIGPCSKSAVFATQPFDAKNWETGQRSVVCKVCSTSIIISHKISEAKLYYICVSAKFAQHLWVQKRLGSHGCTCRLLECLSSAVLFGFLNKQKGLPPAFGQQLGGSFPFKYHSGPQNKTETGPFRTIETWTKKWSRSNK